MVSTKCGSCPYFRTFCVKLRQLPFYKEFRISKIVMPKLPKCFQETLLGEPKGANKQYRGAHGSHVLEYEEKWILHRDKVDPRLDPIGHLVNDAPHVLAFGALVVLVFLGTMYAIGGEQNE